MIIFEYFKCALVHTLKDQCIQKVQHNKYFQQREIFFKLYTNSLFSHLSPSVFFQFITLYLINLLCHTTLKNSEVFYAIAMFVCCVCVCVRVYVWLTAYSV